MKREPLKHDIKAWLTKQGLQPEIVRLLTRESDPLKEARRAAEKRRAGYTDQELDTQTVTLRKYFDMQDKLYLELYKESARHTHCRHKGMDEQISTMEAEAATASATSSQGGTDRKLTEAHKWIAELTEERDAARLAYLELRDRVAKGDA